MAVPRVRSVSSVAQNIPGGIVRGGDFISVWSYSALYVSLVCLHACTPLSMRGRQRLTSRVSPSCSAPYFLRFGLSLSHEAHRGAGQQIEGPAGEDASVPAFLWVLGFKLRFSSPRRAKTANHKLIDGTWQGSEQSSACLEGTEVRPGASEAHGTQP